ncbi:Highly reducing polyketide synthase FUM1 [Lachnellula suecica]|uniref:Highly reducing polyketide synthase FUM1 n=1 Tax=Lachnellula suecica TaxID=602035 RepID=A0A8T9CJA2_9HELO|nr:Highly reducing polyketide synthase FUM1 [Lachnellula suecica]
MDNGSPNQDEASVVNGVNGHIHSTPLTNGNTNGHGHSPHTNGDTPPTLTSNGNAPDIAEPIAIIGMAMRLPGGIRDSEAFWDLLVNKKSAQCRVPQDRYNIDAFYGPGKAGHVGTEYGYFLEDLDLANLDASFWSMTRQEAEVMDPSQRLILEVVYECLENAGATNWRGKDIGCYMGSFGEDWLDMELKDDQNSNMYRMAGYSDFVLSNRVSYEFDFRGPSMTLRTACSSSLTGLHEACMALARGECTSAVVGGTSIITAPRMTIALTEQGVISPTGSCKTFDANADGYARGEGISALYIKRLSDAIRDGDPIRAVIKSTCVNADGKTSGLTMPSTEGHEALIRRGHEVAGIYDYSKTAMIECHGTGTKIGDPIEAKAVANVFGDHGIYIGSIPVPFEKARLVVPVEPMPWPSDKLKRVGVNSFGIGGANAHVVLESAPSIANGSLNKSEIVGQIQPSLLVFSAKHADALRQSVKSHEAYALDRPHALNDMGFSLSTKREVLSHRAFCVTNSSSPFELSSIAKSGITSEIVFTFTGQGAQWAQMGKDLFETQPVFRKSIRDQDAVLSQLPTSPPWTLEDELFLPKNRSRLSEAEFSQPCCTAIQVALVDLLRTWNVRPSAVVGHSSGEIGAAYACESITAKEAILIAYHRGQVTKGLGNSHWGGMAAIGLGRDGVTPYLLPGVIIGCENSPSSVTLTGDMDVLEPIMRNIRHDLPDVLVRSLRVECAYHSYRYQAMIEEGLNARPPRVPFYSSVTGKIIKDGKDLSASYWVKNLVSPVLFYSAVNNILSTLASPKIFLEIGPHSALAGPIRQALRNNDSQVDYVPTLVRSSSGVVDLLNTAGQLWLRNVDIDFRQITPNGKFLRDLPSYSWHYEGRYWSESRLSKDWRLRKYPHHDVLGTRVTQSTDVDPSWRNMLNLDNVPWIVDHEIAGEVLFPGAAFVAIAGEAIRQLSGSNDYTVRRVNITTALVLHEGKPVEVITNLRPVRLTNSLDSSWYDFTVSSLHGDTWIKHVTGQVRPGSECHMEAEEIEPLQRNVPSSSWYRVMRKFGLNYGPRFRPLKNISADVAETIAVATIFKEVTNSKESVYPLHPTTLDATFQLLMAAAFKGVPRLFDKLSVPTYIDELYIKPPKGDITVQATAISTPGGLSGSLVATSEGETVISLKNLHLSPLGDSKDVTGEDPHAAVELQWERDLNFLDAATLMRPAKDITEEHMLLEKFSLACMIETSVQVQGLESNIHHMSNFRTWLATQREKALAGTYPNISSCLDLASCSSEERKAVIEKLYAELSNTGAAAVATAVYRIFASGEGIFEGKVNPLDILLENNTLTEVYDYMQLWEYSEFFKLAAHYKPNLKILEIGAGTGGTTSTILPHLQSDYGERMYASYTYTDISSGFFVGAKERFKDVPALEYAILDITKDPIEQGFEGESFDLIVACNVLHATPSLNETLKNGVLSGWWLGEADGRADEPYVTPERWNEEFKSAGFGGINAVAFDGQLNNNIITMPACKKHQTKRITVLHSGESAKSAHREGVEKVLHDRGYEIDLCTLEERPPPQQIVISLLDINAPFLHDVTAPQFLSFRDFLNHIQDSGILWVTAAAQVNAKDPRYAMILGMARTLRSELQIDFATLELEAFDAEGWKVVADVLHQFEHRVHENEMSPVLEYAYSNGSVQVGKCHWISVPDQLLEDKIESWPKQLDVGRTGALQTLYWKQVQPLPSLTGDWVEIEIRAVGLNFKDVLITMGIVAGPKPENGGGGLGCECSGIVTKVGSEAKNLQVGDRIISIANGSFATTLTTSEKLCTKMSDDLSFVEGATIPCVYGTVIYSLIDLARLHKDQTVLIHSACGGVGIAAIQIAKMIGAEIFCTVGNPEKVQYLMENFNIPRNRIFNSRDASFLPELMAETNGRGVDVALNSLSGELLHATWKCVAEFGIMVEIGKRDFIGQGALSMDLFEQNRSFIGVDLTQICSQRPALMNSLLRRSMEFFKSGLVKPITPIKEFDASHIEDAFRFMQKGQHIGKIVVTLQETNKALTMKSERKKLSLPADRAYLLVGGLGGLGRSVASWLVEKGARHIIFFSRSAGSVPKDDPYFLELEAQGCLVQAFSGSVSKVADVRRAIKAAEKPIGGVLQASMVLNDAAITEMTFEQWQAATQPKVQGTWNLHKVLLYQKEPLHFFFLFSSLSGFGGQPGQANYASANAFLDAFVQCRHSLGLPASVLDIGAMDDVGYLSQNTEILESLRATALHVLYEQDFLDSLQLMINRSFGKKTKSSRYVSRSQVAIGVRSSLPLSAKNNRTLWKRDPRMAVYRNLESQDTSITATTSDNSLKQFLRDASTNPSSLSSDESVALLAKEIGETLFGFMMRSNDDLDLNVPLGSLGVDSLVSIELRNWFRQKVGVEFTVLEIIGSGCLLALGKQTSAKLGEKYMPGSD